MQFPLEDVKVLDLSHALAGPFCSIMLGDFGAQVIKLEVPGAGDISCAWGPLFYDSESVYFVNLHRNKKSIEVDLKPEFRQDHSDVLKRYDKSNRYKIFSVCPNKNPRNTIKNMI